MKTILLVFCLLASSATTLWAHGIKEPTYPPYCWVQPPGSELWYPCDSEEAALADCIKLMESAMRSVDHFVQDSALTSTPEEAVRIKKLWERAKNSCWSDLKGKQPQHYH